MTLRTVRRRFQPAGRSDHAENPKIGQLIGQKWSIFEYFGAIFRKKRVFSTLYRCLFNHFLKKDRPKR
jgi:hypothetical protein